MYSGIARISIWSHVEISWFKLIFTVLKRFFILAKEILKKTTTGIRGYIWWLVGISRVQLSGHGKDFERDFGHANF